MALIVVLEARDAVHAGVAPSSGKRQLLCVVSIERRTNFRESED